MDYLKIILRFILVSITLVYSFFILNYLFTGKPEPWSRAGYLLIYAFFFGQIPALVILITISIYRKLNKLEIFPFFKTDFKLLAWSFMTLGFYIISVYLTYPK